MNRTNSFENVVVHGLIRDENAEKFSKSKGNFPDLNKICDIDEKNDFFKGKYKNFLLYQCAGRNDIAFRRNCGNLNEHFRKHVELLQLLVAINQTSMCKHRKDMIAFCLLFFQYEIFDVLENFVAKLSEFDFAKFRNLILGKLQRLKQKILFFFKRWRCCGNDEKTYFLKTNFAVLCIDLFCSLQEHRKSDPRQIDRIDPNQKHAMRYFSALRLLFENNKSVSMNSDSDKPISLIETIFCCCRSLVGIFFLEDSGCFVDNFQTLTKVWFAYDIADRNDTKKQFFFHVELCEIAAKSDEKRSFIVAFWTKQIRLLLAKKTMQQTRFPKKYSIYLAFFKQSDRSKQLAFVILMFFCELHQVYELKKMLETTIVVKNENLKVRFCCTAILNSLILHDKTDIVAVAKTLIKKPKKLVFNFKILALCLKKTFNWI